MKSNLNKTPISDSFEQPLTMTVADVKRHLHIGNGKAYALFEQKSFPSFKLDGKHLVRRDQFEKWLNDIQKIPDKNYRFTRPS